MFSRFSEVAKNSPLGSPFSVAKCSSDATVAPSRGKLMASAADGKSSNAGVFVECSLFRKSAECFKENQF